MNKDLKWIILALTSLFAPFLIIELFWVSKEGLELKGHFTNWWSLPTIITFCTAFLISVSKLIERM